MYMGWLDRRAHDTVQAERADKIVDLREKIQSALDERERALDLGERPAVSSAKLHRMTDRLERLEARHENAIQSGDNLLAASTLPPRTDY